MQSRAGEPKAGGRKALAVFSNQQFRWLYVSNAAFFFAMMGQMVVRSYLAYDITDSEFALGLVNLMVAIPMLAISPFGGVFADRFERRQLIMAGQATLVINESVVLILMLTGLLEFWHLLAVTFVMGCVFPFVMPARQAIVVSIVGRKGLQNAIALQMGAMNAARVVSPAIAGFVISFAGTEAAYSVAIVLYGIALVSMTRVTKSHPPKRLTATTMLHDIRYGMTYVAKDAPVRALMLLGIVPMLLAMPFQSMLPVFTEDVWPVGATGLGILHAAAGAGGLLGSIAVVMFGETRRKLRLMLVSLVGFGATLLAFAISPVFALAVPLVLIADIFANLFQTTNNTVIQVLIPEEVRGRVMSLMMMTFGLTPLGTVPIAALAQAFGAPFAVAIACVLMLAIGGVFLLVSASFRNIDAISAAALERPDDDIEPPSPAPPATPAGVQPQRAG